MTPRKSASPKAKSCSVPSCTRPATLLVFLEDFNPGYGGNGGFCKRDSTCPRMCREHAEQNEAESTRTSSRSRNYPFSKQGYLKGVCGWTTYRDINNSKRPVEIFIDLSEDSDPEGSAVDYSDV